MQSKIVYIYKKNKLYFKNRVETLYFKILYLLLLRLKEKQTSQSVIKKHTCSVLIGKTSIENKLKCEM